MALGAGKYDDMATFVRVTTKADAVIVGVIRGREGSGFSAQGRPNVDLSRIPHWLRQIADELERDAQREDACSPGKHI